MNKKHSYAEGFYHTENHVPSHKDPYSNPKYRGTLNEQHMEHAKRQVRPKEVKPEPKVIEYGNTYTADKSLLLSDDGMRAAIDALLASFLRTRSESFPGWSGIPTIRQVENYPSPHIELSWYAAVPIEYCGDWNKDEELWNS